MRIEEDLRNNFEEFVVLAIDKMLPDQKIEMTPYLRHVCDQYQQLEKGARVIFNQPPRSLKSWKAKFYAAWYLGKHPSHEIMIISNSQSLAEEIVYDIRRIMKRRWYRRVFPNLEISSDRSSVTRIRTVSGGGLRATSFHSSIAGFGADLLIIDDPNKLDDPNTEGRLENINQKFDGEILSRFNNAKKGIVVIVQHRLDENDLSGHLIKKGYKVVAHPLVAPTTREYKLSNGEVWRREKGDVLLPHSHSKKTIKQAQQVVYPRYFWFQQQGKGKDPNRPFKFKDFAFESRPAFNGPAVISIDTAQRGTSDGSFNVIQVWRQTEVGHHLVEQVREKWDFHRIEKTAASLIGRHRPAAILIENAGQAPALYSQLQARFRHAHFILVEPLGSKEERLNRHRSKIRRGAISLSPGWEGKYIYIDEFCCFPTLGTDQVDATVHYLDFMATKPQLRQAEPRILAETAFRSQRGPLVTGPDLQPQQNPPGIALVLGSQHRRRW